LGLGGFYLWTIPIIGILILILTYFSMFKLKSWKIILSLWLGLIVVLCGVIGIRERAMNIDRNIPRVSENDFDVSPYKPFSENNRVATLVEHSGKITNWKEVGGNDEKIIPFQRNEGSGSQTAFINFMKNNKIIKPQEEETIGGMGGIINRVADYANSIGFYRNRGRN
jgi:hypothetical protein